jgi:hypothetical protein
MSTNWDDLPNDLDFDTVVTRPVAESGQQRFVAAKDAAVYVSPCKRCGGSGRYNHPSSHGQLCFLCHGVGRQEFKTSPEQREKARQRAEVKKENERLERVAAGQAWGEQHKDVIAWLQAHDGRFDFATSLTNALGQYGHLTDGQTAAVRRCIEGDKAKAAVHAAAAAQQAVVAAAAPRVNTDALREAFAKAAGALKRPKLHFGTFVVSLAPAGGKNPGALYVKDDSDLYLGKILDGKFLSSRECSDAVRAEVISLVEDPLSAAKAYGLRTGSCCVCNRELTDPVSVANGIGPICADRFF